MDLEEGLLMVNLFNKMMGAVKKYTIIDYGFFKTLMITFGILIGLYFPQSIQSIIWLVWLIFVMSAAWMIYKILKYMK